jgi:hypothetical protein
VQAVRDGAWVVRGRFATVRAVQIPDGAKMVRECHSHRLRYAAEIPLHGVLRRSVMVSPSTPISPAALISRTAGRRILSRRIAMAGITAEGFDRLSAHALRVGFITAACDKGVRDEAFPLENGPIRKT